MKICCVWDVTSKKKTNASTSRTVDEVLSSVGSQDGRHYSCGGRSLTDYRMMPERDLTRCGRGTAKGEGKKIHHSREQKKPPTLIAWVGWPRRTKKQEGRCGRILRSDWGSSQPV